ncbi:hypothetical protein KIPB_002260 [Kipferlia bialata]|uniref:RING-type domain-containing protein n=1 Tax=Kipferlia bialata TaxID=797122 RepID=A0A9K3CPX6_9EUKA|nr:hypothetical protein KIPB_002260 [Kipferlia bialata]|eukprot:g2260.t1
MEVAVAALNADIGGGPSEVESPCCLCYDPDSDPLTMGCGHVFCLGCMTALLEGRWYGRSGARISFGFMGCPMCQSDISGHPVLDTLMAPLVTLREKVHRMATMRQQMEHGSGSVSDAIREYAYYQCHRCAEPYYGGAVECAAGSETEYNQDDLTCPRCTRLQSPTSLPDTCSSHGTDYIQWKCRYCCSMAVFFCFGTTHFCVECHNNYSKCQAAEKAGTLPPCPAGPVLNGLAGECPLGCAHPPTGSEFCMGCAECRLKEEDY